jgi:hypothetical protein
MEELENKEQMNQVEASAIYEAPNLEVMEVKIPQGFQDSWD